MQSPVDKVSEFLSIHQLDGVMLWHRNNFAWLTGGCDNHIGRSSTAGVAGLLVTRDKNVVCITNSIEAPRIRDEELASRNIEVHEYHWYDVESGKRLFAQLAAGRKFAADHDPFGSCGSLPTSFNALRWSLSDAQVSQYRTGAKLTSQAMEAACKRVRPGMTEKQIAGLVDQEVHDRGGHPVVTLVAADERFEKYRHPIPTLKRFEQVVLIVVCSDYKGMISNMTRVVHVGKVHDTQQHRIQSLANIDAAVNLATRPGRSLGEIFGELQNAYATLGPAGADWKTQWHHHHQGGSTGFAGREVFANPESKEVVLDHQAFAWNPSVPGCKFEDTVLITDAGVEVLTAHSSNWPTVVGRCPAGTLNRAGWLKI